MTHKEHKEIALLPQSIIWIGLIVILAFAAFVRFRLVDLPLERDEGEYAYTGQLMLQGIPPYKLAYNMKLPGTYVAYGAIMSIFGETTRGIHVGLVVVNGVTILLLYFLGRRLFGAICGLVAAGSYAVSSLSYSVLGLAAHATHFVTLFAVGGALLLCYAFERERALWIFWSGIMFGFAFLMKQQAVFFGVFAVPMLIRHEWIRRAERTRFFRSCATLLAGMILPFGVACVALAIAGVLPTFWFWTFSYARQYASIMPLPIGWEYLQTRLWAIFQAAPVMSILAIGGFAFLLRRRKENNACFALALLAASFATACPGLYFRPHYFIPLLAAGALGLGAAVQILSNEMCRRQSTRIWLIVPLVLFVVACSDAVARHRMLFFEVSTDEAARAIYPNNPFVEARELGRYIREHSTPNSRIAVLGSEPEIYFYSHRLSATGYIYTYALVEAQPYALSMQQEMIKQIEAATPEFVVFVNVYASWLKRGESSTFIFERFTRYREEHLEQIGFVDIGPGSASEYHLGDEQGKHSQPRRQFSLTLFKRIPAITPPSLSR